MEIITIAPSARRTTPTSVQIDLLFNNQNSDLEIEKIWFQIKFFAPNLSNPRLENIQAPFSSYVQKVTITPDGQQMNALLSLSLTSNWQIIPIALMPVFATLKFDRQLNASYGYGVADSGIEIPNQIYI